MLLPICVNHDEYGYVVSVSCLRLYFKLENGDISQDSYLTLSGSDPRVKRRVVPSFANICMDTGYAPRVQTLTLTELQDSPDVARYTVDCGLLLSIGCISHWHKQSKMLENDTVIAFLGKPVCAWKDYRDCIALVVDWKGNISEINFIDLVERASHCGIRVNLGKSTYFSCHAASDGKSYVFEMEPVNTVVAYTKHDLERSGQAVRASWGSLLSGNKYVVPDRKVVNVPSEAVEVCSAFVENGGTVSDWLSIYRKYNELRAEYVGLLAHLTKDAVLNLLTQYSEFAVYTRLEELDCSQCGRDVVLDFRGIFYDLKRCIAPVECASFTLCCAGTQLAELVLPKAVVSSDVIGGRGFYLSCGKLPFDIDEINQVDYRGLDYNYLIIDGECNLHSICMKQVDDDSVDGQSEPLILSLWHAEKLSKLSFIELSKSEERMSFSDYSMQVTLGNLENLHCIEAHAHGKMIRMFLSLGSPRCRFLRLDFGDSEVILTLSVSDITSAMVILIEAANIKVSLDKVATREGSNAFKTCEDYTDAEGRQFLIENKSQILVACRKTTCIEFE